MTALPPPVLPDTYFRPPLDPDREGRLARYAERAAARLPLFGDGPPAPPDDGVGRCAGCGAAAPQRKGLKPLGWDVRRDQIMPDRPSYRPVILTCPACLESLREQGVYLCS